MASEESYLLDQGNNNESPLHDSSENGDDMDASSSNNIDKTELAKIRREKDKLRARERRKRENDDAKKERREKCRLAQAQRRKDETAEQREHRLAVDRERAKKRRLKESEEEKQQRLEMNRIRTAIRRRGTVDTALDALKIFNDDPEVKDLLKIPGNRVIQLESSDDPTRITIGVVNEADESIFYKLVVYRKETDEQKQLRLERGRQYAAKRRRQETSEQRQRRLERERNSVRRRRQKNNNVAATTATSSSSRQGSITTTITEYDIENIDQSSDIFEDNVEEIELDALNSLSPSNSISPQLDDDDGVDNPLTPDDDQDNLEEPQSNIYSENEIPAASTSADLLSNINGYLFGNPPLSVPSFSTNEVSSSMLDFSQIYSHVLHPSTSSIADNWSSTENLLLKDKSDMYLMQNLGLDTSTSPSFFNNLPQPQPLQPSNSFFQNSAPADDPTNPMTIGMLLRNLSNTQQAMDNSSFNPSPFGSHSLLNATGLGGICASPSAVNMFNSFDSRIDTLLGSTNVIGQNYFQQPSTSISGLPSVSEADECIIDSEVLNIGLQVSSAGLESIYNCLQSQQAEDNNIIGNPNSEPKDVILQHQQQQQQQRQQRSWLHFNKIVQNSFDSFILLLEATVIELIQDGAQQLDTTEILSPCPDMSIIPNSGLHLVVSAFLLEAQDHRLKNYYYTSIDRLLKIRQHFDPLKLYGSEEDDRCAWSEMYDTLRSLHIEVMKCLWEKVKIDCIDTVLFNAVERAELAIKRIQNRRGFVSIDRTLTFLDLALIELLDLIDHIAQITWIVFPSLARERAEIHNNPTFRLYHKIP
uniref:BZIP domain-containing protein n=1 Tax=Panagrolaimus superbus TaxID=310955 RepID=A0A914YUL0_9BILA